MIKEQIRNGIIFGISTFFTIFLCFIGYAAINNIWTNTSELEVTTESTLSAESWNKLLGNFEFLKSKTENISSNGGNIGIGVTNPTAKLDVNGTLKVTNLQIINSPFTCQKISGGYKFKGDVTYYGANTCIKRAVCPTGYLVTGCSTKDYPYLDSSDRIYNYLMPRFSDNTGNSVSGEGCQWNNTFQNASTNNTFCDSVWYDVVAICCKMN